MNINLTQHIFESFSEDAPRDAFCVKSLPGVKLDGIMSHGIACGRIVHPMICAQRFLGKWSGGALEHAVRSMAGTQHVMIIGHGWADTPDEKFVWTGTADEFCETWQAD